MSGKLYAVGIGPGKVSGMTGEAGEALDRSSCIVGYTLYVDLIREAFGEREYIATGMMKEEERCRIALKRAFEGETVSVICSGDPGVYGMAGLIFSLLPEYEGVTVKVIPGVTAATSGAALLGAPIGHDFAVISLSDRLTPWEIIEKRLRNAAEADFCIAIYNPVSHSRPEHLTKACVILSEILPGDRLCGIARNIGRKNETAELCTLKELPARQADMITTVFIGNSETKESGGRMITPRIIR